MSGKRKSEQGRTLPADGTALQSYPIGCCVLIAPTGRLADQGDDDVAPGDPPGDPAWHIIAFRIGGAGSPHLRKLAISPTSLDWNRGTGPALETCGSAVVLKSCWPERASDHSGDDVERDPMLLGVRISDESEMGFK